MDEGNLYWVEIYKSFKVQGLLRSGFYFAITVYFLSIMGGGAGGEAVVYKVRKWKKSHPLTPFFVIIYGFARASTKLT